MSSFKQLNKADVTTVDYSANKRWSFSYTSTPTGSIAFYRGKNEFFNIAGSTTTNRQYQSSIYHSINHLFYQNYTSSIDTGSLMFNVNTYESASSQRPTSSYFIYNANPLFIDNFPTASNSTISVLNIGQTIYGSKILPYTFNISASGVIINDDGNGNLFDVSALGDNYIDFDYLSELAPTYFDDPTPGVGASFIGNIFYAHGMVVLTNQSSSYQNLLTGSFSSTKVSFQNEHIIYENEIRCIVKESDFNLSYNPTLLKYGNQYIVPISGSPSNGYTTTGSFDNTTIKDFATGSVFQPYVTTIGLYNNSYELIAVAKLAQPLPLSSVTDTTILVNLDL